MLRGATANSKPLDSSLMGRNMTMLLEIVEARSTSPSSYERRDPVKEQISETISLTFHTTDQTLWIGFIKDKVN